MSKYDKLKKLNSENRKKSELLFDAAKNASNEIASDVERTVQLYKNADVELDNIDSRFSQLTQLDKTDIAMLMLATALQIGRWVIIGAVDVKVTEKINNSRLDHDDKSITDKEKKLREKYKERHKDDKHVKSKHRDWMQIVMDGVPYDVVKGSKGVFKMEGGYHRIHTLGHDPVLGWVFGVMNILSDTITLDTLATYKVDMRKGHKSWIVPSSKEPYPLSSAFFDAYDSVTEDHKRLPAAVFAQALHLGSDYFTKAGLPVPVLEAADFTKDFANKLYKEQYDSLLLTKDIAKIGVQAALAALINMLIAVIHGLFYDPAKYENHDLFEVKTRKILSYSNLIASSSNVITVAGMEVAAYFSENPELAKKGFAYMDIGGYIVTMYRLITDTKFIARVKSEFLENEWYKAVVGEDYKFLELGDAT